MPDTARATGRIAAPAAAAEATFDRSPRKPGVGSRAVDALRRATARLEVVPPGSAATPKRGTRISLATFSQSRLGQPAGLAWLPAEDHEVKGLPFRITRITDPKGATRMADDRHDHLANHDDIDTSSRPPPNPPQHHTHVQQVATLSAAARLKGSRPRPP